MFCCGSHDHEKIFEKRDLKLLELNVDYGSGQEFGNESSVMMSDQQVYLYQYNFHLNLQLKIAICSRMFLVQFHAQCLKLGASLKKLCMFIIT